MDLSVKKRLQQFHCGERFRELALQHKKDSPTKWAAILGLHRNQIYLRWKTKDISSIEILMICDELKITVSQFFNIDESASSLIRETKPYIENRLDELESKVRELEAKYGSGSVSNLTTH